MIFPNIITYLDKTFKDEQYEFQNNFLNKRHFNSSTYEFKFNLGYSGYYYQHGNTEENLADEMLISM